MSEDQVEELEGKVIECAWNSDEGVWEYMRERTDKDHPNAWHTYEKVCCTVMELELGLICFTCTRFL